VTTHHDVTDDRCDDIDDLAHITDYDQVTKRMTRWRRRWLTTVSDDMANLSDERCDYYLLQLTTQVTTKIRPDDPDDIGWIPLTIHVMTWWLHSLFSWQHLTTPSGDTYRQSRKLPV
jgi:hypothetical protein